MSSSSESSSEDDTFQPYGFDPSMFRQQRSQQVPTFTKTKSVTNTSTLDYFMLLKRGIHILQNKNSKNETVKLPLEVRREGIKTSMNVQTMSEALDREQAHLTIFLLNELLTVGSVNQEGKLLLKGNFIKQQIQDVLRDYVSTYVVCKSCESLGTVLMKENKLSFVRCRGCGSSRTVTNLKEGSIGRREKKNRN